MKDKKKLSRKSTSIVVRPSSIGMQGERSPDRSGQRSNRGAQQIKRGALKSHGFFREMYIGCKEIRILTPVLEKTQPISFEKFNNLLKNNRMPQPDSVNRSYRYELARKLIHLSSVSIAVIYCTITKELVLVLLVPIFFGFLVVDLMKNFIPPLSRWYHNTFDPMLREHELEKEPLQFNGATYITFSALLLVLIFPKIIAITCFSLVAVSDTLAALAGKKFGHHRIGEKSLEGSFAFLISSLLIVAVIPRLDLIAGIITAITATVVEAFTLRINRYKVDDNLTIPLLSALVCYLYYILVIPHELPLLETCP